MLYLLDTANIEEIKNGFDLYPICGITTNPTILAKEKNNFIKTLKDIRDIIGNDTMLHVQALGKTSDEIEKEALYLQKIIGGNLYIKIPVIPEGIKATKKLTRDGFKVTATAVFTAQQALIAARAGAEFVAPYVNRIDNICGDGVRVVAEIANLFKIHNLNTNILAASFKNTEQVHKVSLCGAHAVTLNYEIMEKLICHPLTGLSVEKFIEDWKETFQMDKINMKGLEK